MGISAEREKLLEEVNRIPDDKLAEVYEFLHHYRLGLEVVEQDAADPMKYAGSWADMPKDDYAAFVHEIEERRRRAFSERPSRETGSD